MEEKEDKNKSEERQQSKRFTKIKLPYLISDLEPEISSLTMFYHYDILHSAYEQGLNNLVDDFEKKNGKFPFEDLVSLLKKIELLPLEYQTMARHFGGGLVNHDLFFLGLKKNPSRLSSDSNLSQEIIKTFDSLETLEKKLISRGTKLIGSGWVWLVCNEEGELQIYSTANQNSPYLAGYFPIIGLDVWEHAYYLDYFTDKKSYLKNLLKLINWERAAALFDEAKKLIGEKI